MGWGALEPENLGQSVDFITLSHLLHLQAFSNGLDGLKEFGSNKTLNSLLFSLLLELNCKNGSVGNHYKNIEKHCNQQNIFQIKIFSSI